MTLPMSYEFKGTQIGLIIKFITKKGKNKPICDSPFHVDQENKLFKACDVFYVSCFRKFKNFNTLHFE